MPEGRRQVSRFEALGSTIAGVGVLALPRLAAETAGTGRPWR